MEVPCALEARRLSNACGRKQEQVERVLLGEAQQESRPGPKSPFWFSRGIKHYNQVKGPGRVRIETDICL